MALDATTLQLLDQRLVASTLLASATVLVYDLLCTLDQEIAYVWSNPCSISSVLFLLNRYLPFMDTFLSIYLKFSRSTSEKCYRGYNVVTWLIVLGTIISEVILMLRTYAIWERRRSVLIVLSLIVIVVFPAAIAITYLEVKSLVYVPRNGDSGCRLTHASPLILVAYVLLVLVETIMAVLTAIKTYGHARHDHSHSPWVLQLHKDGLLFYFYLLMISLANIVVPIVAPPIFANWLSTPQRVIHSALCTRVLFLILRQRSSSMMNRLPMQRDGSGDGEDWMLTSGVDEIETTASIDMIAMTGDGEGVDEDEGNEEGRRGG